MHNIAFENNIGEKHWSSLCRRVEKSCSIVRSDPQKERKCVNTSLGTCSESFNNGLYRFWLFGTT